MFVTILRTSLVFFIVSFSTLSYADYNCNNSVFNDVVSDNNDVNYKEVMTCLGAFNEKVFSSESQYSYGSDQYVPVFSYKKKRHYFDEAMVKYFDDAIVNRTLKAPSNLSHVAAGVWSGVAVSDAFSEMEAVLFVNPNGEISLVLRDGFLLSGNAFYKNRKNSTRFYAPASSNFQSPDFISINDEANIRLIGQFVGDEAKVKIVNNKETLYTVTLVRNADPIAQQSEFTGEWRFNPDDPSSTETWNISDLGIVTGQDLLGCNYTGQIAASSNVNLADVTIIVDSCLFEGLYTGVVSLFVEPGTDRVGVFYIWDSSDYIFVNGLVKILGE